MEIRYLGLLIYIYMDYLNDFEKDKELNLKQKIQKCKWFYYPKIAVLIAQLCVLIYGAYLLVFK